MITVVSFTVGGSMILAEAMLIAFVMKELEDGVIDQENSLFLAVAMFALIPVFVFGGLTLIVMKTAFKKKTIYYGVLYGMLPLLITLPIYDLLDQEEQPFLSNVMLYGPLCTYLLWITLDYIGQFSRNAMRGGTSFTCIFFVVPLLFLSPLLDMSFFSDNLQLR